MRTPSTLFPTPVVPPHVLCGQVIRGGLERVMRLQCHQHAENSALFFAEISGNSITAFSSPSWQAGWWNNMLWFSENCLQINLCEARDSPFSTSIQNSGLDWCRQQLPRWSFCSCQIILQPVDLCVCLCPQFPESRQVLLPSGANLGVKIFSLLWCLLSAP